MDNDILFQAFDCRGLNLRDRIALAPMTRARAGKQRLPNDLMASYYAQRADAALIITEATTVSERANGWNESPGIYTDEMAVAWRPVVDAIHEKGGVVFLQLWHCGRASHSSFHNGQPPVAPSPIKINGDAIHTPNGKEAYEVPQALSVSEITQTIEDYRAASARAKQAGFDGVELHCANGYLLDTFLQSKTNQRDDHYGGSIENRYRIVDEVLHAISTVWPRDRIAVRLSPNGVFNDMGSSDFREQFTYVAQRLDGWGLAYLHVMDGLAFGFHQLGSPMTLVEFRQVFHGPLMGNCGYTRETAQQAIESGSADLIAFGRPFISNPDLVERFRRGWPLAAEAEMSTWYSPIGAQGYTDFPTHTG